MTKLTAFLLFVFCITAAVWQISLAQLKGMDTECLFVRDYSQSRNFISYINRSMYEVMEDQDLSNYYYLDEKSILHDSTAAALEEFPKEFSTAYYSERMGGWIYVAFPDDFLNNRQQEWEANRAALQKIVYRGISFAVFALLLLIFLISTAGLVPGKYGIRLARLDHIYSDIIFIIFGVSTGWLIYLICQLMNSVFPFADFSKDGRTMVLTGYYSGHVIKMINIGMVTALLTTAAGVALLSLVRKIKAGKMIRYSFLYKVIMKGYQAFKDLYRILMEGRMSRRYSLIKVLYYRQQVLIALSLFLNLLFCLLAIYAPIFMVINLALQALVMYWYFRGNKPLYMDISSEFDDRLKEQMKSERMKVDLITNVSHDLKTPLTSIISYLDLLSKEEGLSETAGDYVRVLQEKSGRLKNIVTDLFDLAKSTSGDIALDIHVLDMKKLIEQTLGDMADRIEASKLQLKVSLPDHTVNVNADGKKLYRVFLNIIDNALKYSMKGTRIFVDLTEEENKAVASIKNTAGYEMDFSAEDVLQRFTRGDKSRSTEGSGLGLSIAESFTKVCGGNFKVELEGDMFKVMISFQTLSKEL